jgi:hypothetical protein
MTAQSDFDRFQYWLMDMDDAIDRFVQSTSSDVGARLDGSGESLVILEELVLAKYGHPDQTKASTESLFLDGAARYLGEVLRRYTGSRWTIRFDDPNYVFHGLPILTGGALGAIPCCPLTTVTASTDRRTGQYFSGILKRLSA